MHGLVTHTSAHCSCYSLPWCAATVGRRVALRAAPFIANVTNTTCLMSVRMVVEVRGSFTCDLHAVTCVQLSHVALQNPASIPLPCPSVSPSLP